MLTINDNTGKRMHFLFTGLYAIINAWDYIALVRFIILSVGCSFSIYLFLSIIVAFSSDQ